MKNNFLAEIRVAAVLIILLFILVFPHGPFMPNPLQLMIATIAIVAFGIYASFVLREKVLDEREEKLRSIADRIAFLTGSGVLLLGILVESFHHDINFWLLISLVIMILAKLIARFYAERKF